MMPPKSKRQSQLEDSLVLARESKMRRCSDQDESMMEGQFSETIDEVRTEPEGLAELLMLCSDALNTEDEEVDPSFDLDSSLKSDNNHIIGNFCEEWITHLNHEDRVSFGMFLYFQLTTVLGKGETESAELGGLMITKSDKTIRDWRSNFFEGGDTSL